MRILLVSSSARGHAIAETIARSPQKPDIFSLCTTRNPGIRRIAATQEAIDIMGFPAVLAHAKRWQPDFAIIGPDDPIGGGLADLLEEEGVPCIAPRKRLARIESSKGFARELLQKYGIDASPKFRIFSSHPLPLTLAPRERGILDPLPPGREPACRQAGARERESNDIRRFIEDDLHGNYVIKYDGLKGGKGVKVSGEHLASIEEGLHYAQKCIEECGKVVIEEKLVGVEFSLMSFVSGTNVIHMPAVQDHKRAFEGDTGPNTGGMGSYSMPDHSLPFLTKADLERAKEINQMVAEALQRECNPLPHPLSHCGRRGGKAPHPNPLPWGEGIYRGILYGGYMKTADGVRVIEFNARFGDPEALNVLPLLESDFVDICQGIITGELSENLVQFARKATVCKYIVPEGYPENKNQKGMAVQLPIVCHGSSPLTMTHAVSSRAETRDVTALRIYFGDISEDPDGSVRLGTSRALGIVGIGDTLEEAEQIAQHFCEQVRGPVRFRADIGTDKLLQKRLDILVQLRAAIV